MLRGGSKTPRNLLPVLSRHPFSHCVSRAPCQWDTQDQQGGGRRTPGVYKQMWKSHAFPRKRSILVVGFPPLCLFTDFFWSSFNMILKKSALAQKGQLSAMAKVTVFPRLSQDFFHIAGWIRLDHTDHIPEIQPTPSILDGQDAAVESVEFLARLPL